MVAAKGRREVSEGSEVGQAAATGEREEKLAGKGGVVAERWSLGRERVLRRREG